MATELSDSSDLTIPTEQAFETLLQARSASLLDAKDLLEWEGLVLADPELNIDNDIPFLPDELRKYAFDLSNYVRAVADWAQERLNERHMREREITDVERQIEEIDSELQMYEGIRKDVKKTLGMIKQLKDMGEDVTYLYAALSEIMHKLSYASVDEGDGQELCLQSEQGHETSTYKGQDEISIVLPDGSQHTMKAVKAAKLVQIFLSQEDWTAEQILALRERLGFKENTFTVYVSNVRKLLEPLGWTLSPSFAKNGGSLIRYVQSPASNHISRAKARPHVEPLPDSEPVDSDERDDGRILEYETIAESDFTREELRNIQAILYNLTCYIVDSAVRTTAPNEAIQQLRRLRESMPDRLKAILFRNAFNALLFKREQIERPSLSRDFHDVFRLAVNHLRYRYPNVPLSDKSLLLFQVFKLLKLDSDEVNGVV